MKKIKKGDKVGRISYGKDIIFEVIKIVKLSNGKRIALLKGITERIAVDSELADLELIDKEKIEKHIKNFDNKLEKKVKENRNRIIPHEENRMINEYVNGKILHLDGDRKYSEKSLKYYQKIGLRAIVKNIPEYRQPKLVYNLLEYYKPDVLVITRS